MSKLRVFVSSVQKELEHERAAVAQLISTDPFLLKHCEPVLYDKEPPTGRPNLKAYLIAQALATLKLMEQRGSGFARMRDAMLNHGLDAPVFAEQDGFFVVTFPGPNGNHLAPLPSKGRGNHDPPGTGKSKLAKRLPWAHLR
jgi:hypothetical protein